MIIEGCDDCSSERSICVGGGQIEEAQGSVKDDMRSIHRRFG